MEERDTQKTDDSMRQLHPKQNKDAKIKRKARFVERMSSLFYCIVQSDGTTDTRDINKFKCHDLLMKGTQ